MNMFPFFHRQPPTDYAAAYREIYQRAEREQQERASAEARAEVERLVGSMTLVTPEAAAEMRAHYKLS